MVANWRVWVCLGLVCSCKKIALVSREQIGFVRMDLLVFWQRFLAHGSVFAQRCWSWNHLQTWIYWLFEKINEEIDRGNFLFKFKVDETEAQLSFQFVVSIGFPAKSLDIDFRCIIFRFFKYLLLISRSNE